MSASGPDDPSRGDLDRVFRAEHGRVVATLTRRFGDIDVAEEAAQEAYLIALQRWPESGLPPNPGAWLTTTAQNRAIDRIRRESTRDTRQAQAAMINDASDPDETVSSVVDDRLRLMFTCCHPALATSAQIALTLRLLGGLTVAEIASAFLVDEAAMAKRLTRSKQKIKAARIPYRVPPDAELPGRIRGVLATLFLVFNEGYLPSAPAPTATGSSAPTENRGTPTEPVRQPTGSRRDPHRPVRRGDPADQDSRDADAGRARGARSAGPDAAHRRPPAQPGLRRHPGRTPRSGPLPLGPRLSSPRATTSSGPACAAAGPAVTRSWPPSTPCTPTPDAPQETDWRQIVALYDQLFAVDPTPVVALNRAIAIAEVDGPESALAILDTLPPRAATTPTRPPGRTCSAGPATDQRRSAPTNGRSNWRATRPNKRFSAAGSMSWTLATWQRMTAQADQHEPAEVGGGDGGGPVVVLTISSAATTWSRGSLGSFSSRAMARWTASWVRWSRVLPDGGQVDVGDPGDSAVVVADDRHVLGHRDSGPNEGVEDTKCAAVVERDDGGHPALPWTSSSRVAAAPSSSPGPAGSTRTVSPRPCAVGGHFQRPEPFGGAGCAATVEVGDAPVPERLSGARSRRSSRPHRRCGHSPPQSDLTLRAMTTTGNFAASATSDRVDDRGPSRIAASQRSPRMSSIALASGRPGAMAAEHDVIPGGFGGRVDALDQVAMECLLDLEGHAQQPRSLLPQQACPLIGAVPEVVGDLPHPFPGRRAGTRHIPHDDRHQRHGHPGGGSDVGEGGSPSPRVAARH